MRLIQHERCTVYAIALCCRVHGSSVSVRHPNVDDIQGSCTGIHSKQSTPSSRSRHERVNGRNHDLEMPRSTNLCDKLDAASAAGPHPHAAQLQHRQTRYLRLQPHHHMNAGNVSAKQHHIVKQRHLADGVMCRRRQGRQPAHSTLTDS